MEYRDIRTGQRLILDGRLHGSYDVDVIQVDPRRHHDPVQVRVIQPASDAGTLFWASPLRLRKSIDRS